jgi:hypothetical protein
MPVTIGAGGNGSPGTYGSSPVTGFSGNDSAIGNIIAYGGGGGGSGHYIDAYATFSEGSSGRGGSAGGDSPEYGRNRGMGSNPAPLPNSLDAIQGHSGGSAGFNGDGSYTAGGGGGASRPGQGGRGNWRAGDGGEGFQSSINGTSLYWGGGGGASAHTNTAGVGGVGGGGGGSAYSGGAAGAGGAGYNSGSNGTVGVSVAGGAGGTNTGGGGGGGTHAYSVGGNGGSGIVIVRYSGSQKATGGTITSSGGYTIHTFTSSGTFTPTEWIGPTNLSSLNNTTLTPFNVTRGTSNGGSLDFSGTSSYINLSSNPQAGLTAASYEFWCRPTSLPGSGGYHQMYIQESSTWIALYNVGYVFFGIDLNNGSGWFDNNGGSATGARTTSTLSANSNYHVCYSWNGSTVSVYLNGVLEASVSTLQASNGRQNVTQLGPGTTSRNIGSRYDGTSTNWIGSINLVQFYNRALSQVEVQQNFNALRGRFGI